ncbi:FmdB family zinc ribbon protein [Maridesulfovibrio hydrothermalis]|uniref:Regulatory protein, FmdB family n=1 Tax=Maridesulfovibrio hydrothermalis AM13 = DSM 14728 TaxID=1121451 RepID=L0RAG2_9BACT|nr:zinc ribbon domain-containing protein [Maridesulfovibrio hydrothermalis]CCO22551.1 Regulatory protein, FmdB family [Maridesulfovibrio hydrothermalis AM13 = DSM 14728]
MPIFDYKCSDCGKEFEELVFNRDECPPCPECKSEKTGKLMSACKFKTGGGAPDHGDMGEASSAPSASASSGSSCAGCSGGNCATCG